MANEETPSSVMYAVLKGLKVSNKDVANLVLSDTQKYGEKLLKERIEERTFLSRLTHAEPGMFPESSFADLPKAAQALCSRIVRNDHTLASMAALVAYLSATPTMQMAAACKMTGIDGALFANLVNKVASHPGLSDADKASAIMLAFLATGCFGSPSRATELVENFLRSIASRGFHTDLADESNYVETPAPTDSRLGLVRVVDGALDMDSVHALSVDPEGTIIGSMATDVNSINDVGPLVSKRHVRVFRDAQGNWFAQGLGSTNGTTLISGSDKQESVVELPKKDRKGAASEPVSLMPGDALHLAGTTVFLTIKLA